MGWLCPSTEGTTLVKKLSPHSYCVQVLISVLSCSFRSKDGNNSCVLTVTSPAVLHHPSLVSFTHLDLCSSLLNFPQISRVECTICFHLPARTLNDIIHLFYIRKYLKCLIFSFTTFLLQNLLTSVQHLVPKTATE